MEKIRMYKHHIVPRHSGGSDDSSNLVEVTYTQHTMYHFCEWQRTGNVCDYKAWKMMRGEESYVAGWNKGKTWSEETKRKISKSKKGISIKNSGQNNWDNRIRAKQGIVKNIKTQKIYTGIISDIARELGLKPCHLLAVASGHRKTHKGFIAYYE